MALTRFELPRGWTWSTLGELTSYLRRGRGPKYAQGPEVPVINQKCIRWGSIEPKWMKYATSDHFERLPEEHVLKDGDVLWNSTGTGTIGRAAVFRGQTERPTICDSHVTIIRPIEVLPEYLLYWIASDHVQNSMDSLNAGSTNQIELSRTEAMELPVPVAPLSEQRRIVEKIEVLLSDIENGVESLNVVDSKLASYQQSVLKAGVTGEITCLQRNNGHFSSDSGKALLKRVSAKYTAPKDIAARKASAHLPFELPRDWAWAALPELGEFGRGKSKHRPRNDPRLYGGPYPFIQTGIVRNSNGRITHYTDTYNEKGLRQSKLWPSGTICITIAANIAESGIMEFKGCFPDSVVGLIPDEEINGRFVEYFIRTAKNDLNRFAPATAQKNINLNTLYGVLIPLPPRLEQDAIVDAIDERIASAGSVGSASLNVSHQSTVLRRSILNSAFAGRLVPQDPNDEPASELLAHIRAQHAQTPKASGRRRGRPRKREGAAA